MRPGQLAAKYMEIVFGGGPYDMLAEILADDCTFSGPFYSFDSAEAYIESLNADPPSGFEYELVRAFEDEQSACLIYQFSKPGVTTVMAQMFEVAGGKIQKIVLVFDREAFAL